MRKNRKLILHYQQEEKWKVREGNYTGKIKKILYWENEQNKKLDHARNEKKVPM